MLTWSNRKLGSQGLEVSAIGLGCMIAGLNTTNLRHLGFSDGGLREDMDDAQMNAWLRANAESFAHMADGCRLGLDEDAVVDPQLRVQGLDGLHVVDISVLPVLVSGHSQAAVMAMGGMFEAAGE